MVALSSVAVFAAEKPRVLVYGIEPSEPALAKLAEAATQQLETELSRSGDVVVLGQRDLVATLGLERQRQLLGCSDEGCAFEMGSALSAAWMVGGTLGGAGERLRLDLRVLRLKDSVAVWRDGRTFVDPGDLFPTVTQLAAAARSSFAPGPVIASPATRSAGPWVLMGAGAVLAAGGGVAIGAARAEFEAVQSRVDRGNLTVDEGMRRTETINAVIIAGVVGASAGGVALLSGLIWKLAEPPLTPVVTLSPNGMNFAVGGVF
jgi:TolB-like protein